MGRQGRLAAPGGCQHAWAWLDRHGVWRQCWRCLLVTYKEVPRCGVCGRSADVITSVYSRRLGYVHYGSCCADPEDLISAGLGRTVVSAVPRIIPIRNGILTTVSADGTIVEHARSAHV
jgi:hypothetical protein